MGLTHLFYVLSWEILLAALALALILEGLAPFIAPKMWQKMMQEASSMPIQQVRLMGLIIMSIGLLVLLIFT